jgi:hypothetical protein
MELIMAEMALSHPDGMRFAVGIGVAWPGCLFAVGNL